ncbi:UDP-4-amino-4,6-dideoxy-N-acetyl-beta-L-altrosamine transaminase [Candidatus Aerophobetes bacterium]|nr:UDP-4-amino-4,6-dideoxy-N-acetyl-beta-L-altrosamine transaminase [Candidatus Aerophobetes bacterium]
MLTYLPYGHHWIDDEDIKEVVKVLKGDWITQGQKVKEFEKALAEYTGARYAVVFNSGTSALHASSFAAGIRKDDEVITTPISFVATSNCILYSGAKPVFADIKEDTYTIDPEEIEKKITPFTRAIIPVDFAGQPADLEKIHQIAKENNLVVIEDASHALGAEYRCNSQLSNWLKVGSCYHSDMTIFSFHPVKLITTGEGGAVITNNKKFYEKLLLFRNHGITRNRNRFINKDEGHWYYEMQTHGYNYRITDFQCALGISQLKKLPKFLTRRREIAQRYNEAFKNIEEIIIPYEKPNVKSAWHLYVIKLKLNKLRATRRGIFEALRRENIGVQVHYIPIYYQPYYQELGYKRGLCPVAERYYEQAITLPIFPRMEERDILRVINTVKRITARFREKEEVLV